MRVSVRDCHPHTGAAAPDTHLFAHIIEVFDHREQLVSAHSRHVRGSSACKDRGEVTRRRKRQLRMRRTELDDCLVAAGEHSAKRAERKARTRLVRRLAGLEACGHEVQGVRQQHVHVGRWVLHHAAYQAKHVRRGVALAAQACARGALRVDLSGGGVSDRYCSRLSRACHTRR